MNSPGAANFDAPRSRRFPLSLVFAVVLFGLLFRMDFPKPTLDDLFFVGASLHLAEGGDFSNPMVERQGYPSHYYFGHPPTFSYALAGWLKLVGISSASMLSFELLLYLLICGSLIGLLRQYRARAWLEWLVPLGVLAALLPEGLRPESLAVALSLGGFALVECGRQWRWKLFLGVLLLIFGGSADSRLIFYSAALFFVALWGIHQRGLPLERLFALAGAALVIVVWVLLEFISFRVAEFWQTYHFLSAGKLIPNKLAAGVSFGRDLSVIQWPLLFAWLAVLPWLLLGRHPTRPMRLGRALLLAFVLTGLVGALGHVGCWQIFLMLLLALAAISKTLSARRGALLAVTVVAALLVADSRIFIYAAGQATNRIKADLGPQIEAARALRSTPEHPVLIDSEAARYVFDYRLPPGFLDWNFSAKFPNSLPTDDPLRPDDRYLIGPASVDWLNVKTHLNRDLPRWQPVGPRKSFHEFPRRAYIISPEECGGLPLNHPPPFPL